MADTWCRICGKKYKVCPSCENVKSRTPWRVITDTAPHYQVWLIMRQYQTGLLDKATARKMLLQTDILENEVANFIPSVQEFIASINQVSDIADTSVVSNIESNAAEKNKKVSKTLKRRHQE